jgi:ABC-type transport system involved in multi-copper enzyme maturation permease subunit
MGLGVSLALVYVRRGWDPLVWRVWPAVFLIYLELMILTAAALLFSSFSSPALSALLTFFVFIIGHFSSDLKALAHSMGSAPARWFFSGLYYLLPNFSNYSVITATAHGYAPGGQSIMIAVAYAIVYISVLIAATALIFSRRNLK